MTAKNLRDQIVDLVHQFDREHEADYPAEDKYPGSELIDALACGLAVFSVAHGYQIRHSLNAFEHAFKIRYQQVLDRL